MEGTKETAEKGRIVTVLGSEKTIDHDLSKLLYGLLPGMSTIANNDQTRSPAASTSSASTSKGKADPASRSTSQTPLNSSPPSSPAPSTT